MIKLEYAKQYWLRKICFCDVEKAFRVKWKMSTLQTIEYLQRRKPFDWGRRYKK